MPTNSAGGIATTYQNESAVTRVVPIVYTAAGTINVKQPAGSAVIGGGVVITTAFAGGTPQTLSAGITGDLTDYASTLTLTAAGVIPFDDLATASTAYAATERDIVFTLSAGATPSAGAGFAYVTYIMCDRTP